MTSFLRAGCTAVITGASSGIGREASLYCAERGMNVWMVDLDADELDAARQLVESKRLSPEQLIESRVVDVSNLVGMQDLSDDVFSISGAVHFLMNNAGIGSGGGAMTDMETVHRVMAVNTYGPIHGCLAFVPKMRQMKESAWVVNTGSKQGITMPPGNLTYNMSKAALKCYTEGLSFELKDTNVNVALLIPGWVNTSILLKSLRAKAEAAGDDFNVENVFFHQDKPASGAWMPRQVIDYMIQHLDQGSFYIVCPDNDVDCETDKLRITWTMNDIIHNRPPLSRWRPEYKDLFEEFMKTNGK